MTAYQSVCDQLKAAPRTWLITGVAGFIGSNLLETLLGLEQRVVGLDDLSTGHRSNLDEVRAALTPGQWGRFQFQPADIADEAACRAAAVGVDYVLHHAALASVPLSLSDPQGCHLVNVTGFLNLMQAAREAQVRRVVYASSSAVYGDDPAEAKQEDRIGRPLSFYAAAKRMNELYADTFAQAFGLESVGLRYFNIFGPRQDPAGAYAAVIPRWIAALLRREAVEIYGDGETTRDFCHVAEVVQANLLAATSTDALVANRVYNVGLGSRTSLNELFARLQVCLRHRHPALPETRPKYLAFRPGDVRHSCADIRQARQSLGFEPQLDLTGSLDLVMDWYQRKLR